MNKAQSSSRNHHLNHHVKPGDHYPEYKCALCNPVCRNTWTRHQLLDMYLRFGRGWESKGLLSLYKKCFMLKQMQSKLNKGTATFAVSQMLVKNEWNSFFHYFTTFLLQTVRLNNTSCWFSRADHRSRNTVAELKVPKIVDELGVTIHL